MLIEVKVPILSESISEATLVTWHKKAGEYVRADESLVDLETDKVVLEVVAPKDGVLSEIKKGDGVNVTSDEIIAVIDTDAEAVNDAAIVQSASGSDVANITSESSSQSQIQMPTQAPEKTKKKSPAINLVKDSAVKVSTVKDSVDTANVVQDLSPAVRKLVVEYKLDPSQVKSSGKNGRLTKGDVISHIKSLNDRRSSSNASANPNGLKEAQTSMRAPELKPISHESRPEKRVPMSRLRARVAQRLKEAQNTAAILTTFNEVNMQPIMDMRNKYKDLFLERYSVKLGFMSFFAKVVADALKQYPIINASIDGKDIVYHGYYDIGIAVSSKRGLVVPIMRDVDSMSFSDIEIAINTFVGKARDGKLSLDDLTGGTFSISNGGVFGSMLGTPILNPPQSAILGMHSIQQRPVAENGEVVIRPIMYLALSYDHRIIDGHDAVLFLVAVKEALEDPARILLDV
jgi:2-oxoglutarate dehydrogenase E2 component (dihydrolipoamide succinyltransferase)